MALRGWWSGRRADGAAAGSKVGSSRPPPARLGLIKSGFNRGNAARRAECGLVLEEEGRKRWEGEELDAGSVADLARRRTNRLRTAGYGEQKTNMTSPKPEGPKGRILLRQVRRLCV